MPDFIENFEPPAQLLQRASLFLDIDGTLIPFGAETPCEQDRTALLRARAAGHKVLINTGRSSGFLPPVLRTAWDSTSVFS